MKRNMGFTLVELMVVIAIIGIVTSIAVPSFSRMLERNRLKGAVETLQADLQWMRTQSIKQSCNLQASFDTTVWSYQIYQLPGNCICPAGGANCVLRTKSGTDFSNVVMGTPAFGGTLIAEFNSRRGEARKDSNNTFNNGGITFNTDNYSARVVISRGGRVRTCTPTGTTGVPTYSAC